MAHYTITIKTLIDNNFDFKLTSYPIFDENYRETLNNNILNHFYENEIGFETPALFRFYLNQRLNEIMPYYNILYEKQALLIQNFDNNVNLTETFESKNEKNDSNTTTTTSSSSSESNSNSSSNNKNLFLDTPQGNIYKGSINDTNYATNVTFDENSNSSKINDSSKNNGSALSSLTSNSSDNYIKKIIGNNGNKFSLDILKDLQNSLLNIDMMILNDLSDLFMQIF